MTDEIQYGKNIRAFARSRNRGVRSDQERWIVDDHLANRMSDGPEAMASFFAGWAGSRLGRHLWAAGNEIRWERVMHDPFRKADRYRKEPVKCYELAKSCSPGFLRDCYRRVALQYLFTADGELKLAESQSNIISKQEGLDT
jgi:hypothetical protein